MYPTRIFLEADMGLCIALRKPEVLRDLMETSI